MNKFKGKNLNFAKRLIFCNYLYIDFIIILLLLFFIFKNSVGNRSIFFLSFSIILSIYILIIFNKSKYIINEIIIDEDYIYLNGKLINKEFRFNINLNESIIKLSSKSSKNICSNVFFLVLKTKDKIFKINNFNSFTDEQIIQIFTEYKNLKNEKIIIDEKLIINRINEKIKKCQSLQTSIK